jgi:CDP-paratose 2-epimerase
MKILVTGSSGLISSEVCTYLGNRRHILYGIDNNKRANSLDPIEIPVGN